MRRHRTCWTLAFVFLAAVATSASAQDYTRTNVSNQFATPPTTATDQLLTDDQAKLVALPFDFPYYGTVTSDVYVHDNGYIQVAATPPGNSTFFNSNFPPAYTVQTDGMIAPAWDDLNPTTGTGKVLTHTTGSTPNRVFHVTWENINHFFGGGAATFQVQLFETSGRIVFAYSVGTWTNYTFSAGIEEPGQNNTRFVSPNTNGLQAAKPTFDSQFDPTITNFEGRILMDELVTTADGIGAAQNDDVALDGMRIELFGAGAVRAFTTLDANGDFDIRGVALDGSLTGELRVVAQTAAATVKAGENDPVFAASVRTGVAFNADLDLGTYTIDDTNDADGSDRAPLQIARSLEVLRNYVTARTTDTVPPVDVFLDSNSSLKSSYTVATQDTGATLRIASGGASNPDGIDVGVLARVYSRHVLTNIASQVSGTFANDIDSASDGSDAAFADGFGAWLLARSTGATAVFDGLTDSTADELDLETPSLSSTESADVPGWVAASLFDLLDGTIAESHDTVDGTLVGANDHVFEVVDALDVAPDVVPFLSEWDDQAHDSVGLVRNFIHHGLLGDDASEPNDSAAEADARGQTGQRVAGQTLNRFNEDWYEYLVPTATDSVTVDLSFNRGAVDADITLTVLSTSGAVLATGVEQGDTGPIQAVTGAIGPATIRVRIEHDGGDRLDSYDLQVYSTLRASGESIPEWTVNRALTQNYAIQGGIPPYRMVVRPPSTLPPGFTLDSANLRLRGAPLDVGTVAFSITIEDSAVPVNSASASQSLIVNRALTVDPPEFTGVALGKTTDVGIGRSGGTNPITIDSVDGILPGGLQLQTPALRITGTPATPGGETLTVDATDLAGSSDSGTTTVVVCVPIPAKNTALDLAAGADATAGFFFDAVAGSVASLKVKTGKKQAKRLLGAVILGPDGAPIEAGKIKGGNGKATLAKIPLAASGRYFVALSAADGEATQLVGTLKLAPPKKAKAKLLDLGVGDEVILDVGALAGARFTAKLKSSKDFSVRLQFLFAPDGSLVPAGDIVITEKGSSLTISTTFTQSGTYQLRLLPNPGSRGDLSYSLKIKQPKGVVFVVD